MSLRKKIEKSLEQEDIEVDPVEDQLMKDSVLQIASSDFKELDVLDVPLPNRKRSAIDIDSEYPGKPVSRKKYGRDIGLDYPVSSSDHNDVSDRNSSDDNDEEESDVEDEEGSVGDEESLNEDLHEEESEDGEEGEESDVGEDLAPVSSKNAAEADNEDSPVKLFSSKPASSVDVQKGLAVKEQLRIWDSLLEFRIKLEPGLVATNQLYQLNKMSEFASKEKSSDSSSVDNALNAVRQLSLSLSQLQKMLGGEADEKAATNRKGDVDSDNESIRSSEASGVSDDEDTPIEDKNEERADSPQNASKPATLKQSYSNFSSFRDSELEKWNEKAKISSGKAAQKDFSAFDQSILKVIESILYDKHRLVKKTQLKRTDYEIYGKPKIADERLEDEDEEFEVNQQKKDRKKELIYDPEIFDDGDFYQKLLRDFIEGKSSDGKNERKLVELHKLRIKMKRKVDTKATKGRKLRYVVHPKLVNFMAPVPSNNFSEEAQTQLLKSLFGQAVSRSAAETVKGS